MNVLHYESCFIQYLLDNVKLLYFYGCVSLPHVYTAVFWVNHALYNQYHLENAYLLYTHTSISMDVLVPSFVSHGLQDRYFG